MRQFSLASALLLAALTPAWAGTPISPRPFVALGAGAVRLSDLFAGLPSAQDQPIGQGPTPGNQIVVASDQLNAIAAQFGVDWHDADGSAHVILARPGVALPGSALAAVLKTALAAQGAPPQFDLALTGYTPPMVAPQDQITPVVGSLQYDPASGGFSALVTITGTTTPAQSLRVAGQVTEVAAIPVLTRLVPAHAPIGAGDIRLVTRRLSGGGSAIARSPEQLIGFALHHVVPPGAPVPISELSTPNAVEANAMVEMDLETGNLRLAGRAIAEQAGTLGDMIRVRNPSSLAVMIGQITGPNQVRVDPNSQPIIHAHQQELASR